MAKVLLINPSYVPSYSGTKASIVNPVFPTMGLAAIAATAMQSGHEVEILDLSYIPYNFKNIQEYVLNYQPDIVGITATTPLMNQLRDISVLIKDIAPEVSVVGGGPHVTALPIESLRESKLDVVFIGEADYSFAEFCDGKALHDIDGIAFYEGNEIILTPARTPVENLDDLPMPAWELYDAEVYKTYGSRLYTRFPPQTGIEFSRGCVYKCDFCASKMTMALGYRKKSPERCANEMKRLAELGFKEAMVVDDIFTSDQDWAVNVCEAITDADVDVHWTCSNGIRVESANEQLFKKMRKAKCYRVSFGFESGDDEVLKKFGKGGRASIEEGRNAVRLARKAKIDSNGFFMLGLSADTEKSMSATINYGKELPLDMMKFGRTIAFPGTDMFYEYHNKGIIRSYNWDDYFMYSTQTLFTHPELSKELIEEYIDIAYKKAVLYNPGFIFRRLWRGIKNGDFFWDAFYGVKFYLMPSLSTPIPSVYYAEDQWPTYNFENAKINKFIYQVARKNKKNKSNNLIYQN